MKKIQKEFRRKPVVCLNIRTTAPDRGSQTRTIPSSDPEISKSSTALYAKQVIAFLWNKTTNVT